MIDFSGVAYGIEKLGGFLGGGFDPLWPFHPPSLPSSPSKPSQATNLDQIVAQWANLSPAQRQSVLAGLSSQDRATLQSRLAKAGVQDTGVAGGINTDDLTARLKAIQAGGAAGGAAASAGPPSYTTPDGHVIIIGSQDDAFYQMADSLWTQVYGQHAPWATVQALQATGVKTKEQLSIIIDEMPSDIPGVNIGTRARVKNTATKLADKYWGRPIPDSLVKQLATQGITSPGQIQLWFDEHPGKDIPKEEYQAVFDLANKWLSDPKAYNTVPHPDQVAAIHAAASASSTAPAPPGPVQGSVVFSHGERPMPNDQPPQTTETTGLPPWNNPEAGGIAF